MNETSLEEALRKTLQDHRLSRGEKRALGQVIDELGGNERRLAIARSQAFELAREELSGTPNVDVLEWLEDVVKLLHRQSGTSDDGRRSEAHFSPNEGCVSRINRLFESARRSADVCVYTITDDRIKDAILAAHRRKVAIRIISDNEKSGDLGSDVEQLMRAGVPVRVDRSEYHMHHKYAIFDNTQLLTGSYNWTRSAAKYNEENFIITSESALVNAFRNEFAKLWDQLK